MRYDNYDVCLTYRDRNMEDWRPPTNEELAHIEAQRRVDIQNLPPWQIPARVPDADLAAHSAALARVRDPLAHGTFNQRVRVEQPGDEEVFEDDTVEEDDNWPLEEQEERWFQLLQGLVQAES